MLQFDWQLIVVMLTLGVAAWYLARRGMKTFRSSRQRASGGSSCGSCGSCSAGEKAVGNSTAGFVPLDDLMTTSTVYHADKPHYVK